jgi:hypothetical protein
MHCSYNGHAMVEANGCLQLRMLLKQQHKSSCCRGTSTVCWDNSSMLLMAAAVHTKHNPVNQSHAYSRQLMTAVACKASPSRRASDTLHSVLWLPSLWLVKAQHNNDAPEGKAGTQTRMQYQITPSCAES